jgi:hypothetical protein
MVDAFHFGTMADSKLDVSYRSDIRAQLSLHHSDTGLGGQIVGDPAGNVFLERERVECSKDCRNKRRPACQLNHRTTTLYTYVPIKIQRAT